MTSEEACRQCGGLVHSMARQLYTAKAATFGLERADLISAGYVALLESVKTFDPNRGFKLCTYAGNRVRFAMLDVLRTGYKGSARCDLSYPANTADWVFEYGPDLRRAVQTMSEADRRIIELYFYGGYTTEEIGKGLGSSKGWISRRMTRLLGYRQSKNRRA